MCYKHKIYLAFDNILYICYIKLSTDIFLTKKIFFDIFIISKDIAKRSTKLLSTKK